MFRHLVGKTLPLAENGKMVESREGGILIGSRAFYDSHGVINDAQSSPFLKLIIYDGMDRVKVRVGGAEFLIVS